MDYGGGLSNPVLLLPPDGNRWKVYWTKYNDGIWFEKGWKEFATHDSLDHCHMVYFAYKEGSHFDVRILDMSTFEIEYPSHDIQQEEGDILEETSDESLGSFYEPPSCKRTRRQKSSNSRPQPEKKLRTNTCGDVGTSSKPRNMSKHVQMEENVAVTEALKRATTIQSMIKNPSFVDVLKRPYVTGNYFVSFESPSFLYDRIFCLKQKSDSSVLRFSVKRKLQDIPPVFAKKHLKINQGSHVLLVLDDKHWPVKYNFCKFESGWKKFVSDNHLDVGDVCVFELKNRFSVKVRIFRASEEPHSPPLSQDERHPCQKSREKSPMFCPQQPRKKSRTSTSEEHVHIQCNPSKERNLFGKSKAPRSEVIGQMKPSQRESLTDGARKKSDEFVSSIGNPYFMEIIKSTKIGDTRPTVPHRFVRENLNNKEYMVLQCENKLWGVKLHIKQAKLSKGWNSFANGDACVFELVLVHIFRGHN